jgi:hypothetical protein
MTGWSMKQDRELIKLAGEKRTVNQIAAKMDTSYLTVLKAAKRLGVHLGPQAPRPDSRFKAKGK